ncbi:succinyl-diaminopimelate desuccinylase [Pseudoalteromonas sp. SMS1]|uniref:succinyl-diaminopimelate desuccinylase n=1 Tax=Pseudoalteromonas sp. SMS1 TaxID=2908894 RepID=UPI001F3D011C|nr:succinyl-diaminopimelate desuccinylase [Pseudoalteromonas sp. SMS1]MCF2859114.1 succinyl-diaminopimelate desuccinylase [Pseudoalteromonas sp. SMS1]
MSIAEQVTHIESRAMEYLKQLVGYASITPEDAGCQDWLIAQLEQFGAEIIKIEEKGVKNFIAKIGQGQKKSIAFAGHTDVVPPGDSSLWKHAPFACQIEQGHIYGRGVVDMKGGIACALSALSELDFNLTDYCFYFLITGDEEGEAEYGTRLLVEYFESNNIKLDYCIIGEPSSSLHTGDAIKIGRRGAISYDIEIEGKAAHVAYPDMGINAIHRLSDIIRNIINHNFDKGCDNLPGTTIQITHIDSGAWTDNIIPRKAKLSLNVRFSAKESEQSIDDFIRQSIEQVQDNYKLSKYRYCPPYMSNFPHGKGDNLLDISSSVIQEITGKYPIVSTSGGTSDGRFISRICEQTIELGLPNKTIHQINENVSVSDLKLLEQIYIDLFEILLSK